MVSVREIWGKIKVVFESRSPPTELTLECNRMYPASATSVQISGISYADLVKLGGVNVQKILAAVAHGLRLFDDYQYVVCTGYQSVYSKLSPKEVLELQNELHKSKQIVTAVSAALIALSIRPENQDIAKSLTEILYKIVNKALEIESENIPHVDSKEAPATSQLMSDIGISKTASIDIGGTTLREKILELSKDDPNLKNLLNS